MYYNTDRVRSVGLTKEIHRKNYRRRLLWEAVKYVVNICCVTCLSILFVLLIEF